MSKKGKLILATAVFGAALFAASCGGGDNGGTTAGGGSGGSGGGGGTEPTVEGRVLALLDVGNVSAGLSKPVTICQLKSDDKAYCGSDLNPTADVELEYLYEFGNGNVVLKGASNVLYFFNGSQVIRPTSSRPLGASSTTPETPEPTGITIPTGATVHATPNFVILVDNSGATRELRVITSSGKVIKDSGSSDFIVNASCEAVTQGTNTFKLNTDGTSSPTTIPTTLAEAGGKFLVKDGDDIYLTSDGCSASGVKVATISDVDDAKMVAVVEGTSTVYYIAVRSNDTNLRYYKVSGTTPTPLNTSISLYATDTDKYYYALDGRGRLYAITDANQVSVFNADGTSAGRTSVTGVAGLLGLADRVLAKAGTNVHEITITSSGVNAVNKGTVLYEVVDRCTHTSTIAIDGASTNFIRCAHNSRLYSLTFDSGSGLYSKASHSITSISGVEWATNKALVKAGTTIHLCNTTTAPSISCNTTDLPDTDPTNINLYLKFNGNDVFYRSGSTLKVGDIFGPPSALPITVSSPSSPSGGNASFDLNRFAFSFGPASCRNQIAYFSSRTASPKTYTIVQPSNACVGRILKVY